MSVVQACAQAEAVIQRARSLFATAAVAPADSAADRLGAASQTTAATAQMTGDNSGVLIKRHTAFADKNAAAFERGQGTPEAALDAHVSTRRHTHPDRCRTPRRDRRQDAQPHRPLRPRERQQRSGSSSPQSAPRSPKPKTSSTQQQPKRAAWPAKSAHSSTRPCRRPRRYAGARLRPRRHTPNAGGQRASTRQRPAVLDRRRQDHLRPDGKLAPREHRANRPEHVLPAPYIPDAVVPPPDPPETPHWTSPT